MANKIKLAPKKLVQHDRIDEIFSIIPKLSQQRLDQGLSKIISLGIGEPHLKINPYLLQYLSECMQRADFDSEFYYSQLEGRAEALAAVVKLYESYYPKANYTIEEVMITNGAIQALYNAMNLLLAPGDKVLLIEPYFSSYETQLKSLDAQIIKQSTIDNDFRLSAKDLKNTLQLYPDIKLIILNYPNNPSGINLTASEWQAIANVLGEFPCIAIIIDDVYRELCSEQHVTLLDVDETLKDRCILINSTSKGLIGAPAMRIGMVGAPADWISKMTVFQANIISSVSYLSQLCLVGAVESKLKTAPLYEAWINQCIGQYRRNVAYVAEQLTSMGFKVITSDAGFYILCDASFMLGKVIPIEPGKLATDNDIVTYFLYGAGIATIPGSIFGIDANRGFLRISCARFPDELESAMRAIKEAVNALS